MVCNISDPNKLGFFCCCKIIVIVMAKDFPILAVGSWCSDEGSIGNKLPFLMPTRQILS